MYFWGCFFWQDPHQITIWIKLSKIRDGKAFLEKDEIVNIFCFVIHLISISCTFLCYSILKTIVIYKQLSVAVFQQNIFTNGTFGQIGFMGHHMSTCFLNYLPLPVLLDYIISFSFVFKNYAQSAGEHHTEFIGNAWGHFMFSRETWLYLSETTRAITVLLLNLSTE